MNHLKKILISLLICSTAACGWHLRGQVDVPVSLRILDLQAPTVNHTTRQTIRQTLLSNGITLSKDATYQLVILKQTSKKRTLAVTSNAKASEYELIQSLHFVVRHHDGQDLSGTLEVTSYRTQLYDATVVIAKAQEEQNLRRQMTQDNASKLLRRLQKLSLSPRKTGLKDAP